MGSNLDRYKADLDKLIKLGSSMQIDVELRHRATKGKLSKEFQDLEKKVKGAFERDYQKWYSEAFAVIKQLAPDRAAEFEHLYKGEGKRRHIDAVTYNIQDWMNGIRSGTNDYTRAKLYDDFAIVVMRFKTQSSILEAMEQRFESSLFDIRQLYKPIFLTPSLNQPVNLLSIASYVAPAP
jgi:hypothetical protein